MTTPSVMTRSGLLVDLLAPAPSTIRLIDVAYALSRIPRFNGHTSRFWSGADHSLLVLQLMGDDAPPPLRLAALLHDGHEGYIGDMTSPVHVALGTLSGEAFAAVVEMKERFDRSIEIAFALPAGILLHPAIKTADKLALAIEVKALMATPPGVWNLPTLPERVPELPQTDQMRAHNQFLLAALQLLKESRGGRFAMAAEGAEVDGG